MDVNNEILLKRENFALKHDLNILIRRYKKLEKEYKELKVVYDSYKKKNSQLLKDIVRYNKI